MSSAEGDFFPPKPNQAFLLCVIGSRDGWDGEEMERCWRARRERADGDDEADGASEAAVCWDGWLAAD